MQSRWNTWPQPPKAIDKPFSLAALGLAWYSIEGSFKEFLQIAQVSCGTSQAHIVTAFHSVEEENDKYKIEKKGHEINNGSDKTLYGEHGALNAGQYLGMDFFTYFLSQIEEVLLQKKTLPQLSEKYLHPQQ